MTDDAPRRLLIVEDDARLAATLAESFLRRGYQVQVAAREAGALETARRHPPTHAIVDLKLTEGSGLGVGRELAARDPETRIVVLTGFAAISTAV